MKNLKLALLALAVSIFILSCGTEGPVGPQGPQGNANVISTVFNIDTSAWVPGNNDDWVADFQDGEITTDVVNSGAVEVFQFNGSFDVALPYTTYLSGYSESFTYSFSLGTMLIDIAASITTLAKPASMLTFNVVAITADGINKAKQNGYNLNNLDDMKKLANQKLARIMVVSRTQTGIVTTKVN